MKIFQTVQKNLELLGFIRNHHGYRFYPFSIRHLKASLIFIVGLISIFTFAIHSANSPGEYMDSFYIFTVSFSIFVSYTTTSFEMSKLFDYFDNFEKICNEKSEQSPEQKKKLDQTNQLVQLLSNVAHLLVVKIGVPGVILPKAIFSFYVYFATDAQNDAFEIAVPSSYPFDWENPFGYSVAVILQCIVAFYLLHYLACFASIASGAYLFATSVNGFMKDDLKSINKMVKIIKSESDIFEPFSRFVRTHAEVKQIHKDFSAIYDITMTLLFLGCTITLCITLLMLQIEISHDVIDFLMLLKSIIYGVFVFGGVFFTCELGQRFSMSFEKVNDVISQLDWYRFPIGIQRLLPVTIMNVQEPVVIKCFGNILCSREQFKKVVNTAYSYFMTLRQFYK